MIDPIAPNRSVLSGKCDIDREIGQSGYSLSEREFDPLRTAPESAALAMRVGLNEGIFTSPTGGRPQ